MKKLFIVYAHTKDGGRDLLWIRRLPADFDWNAWQEARRDAMRILNITRFSVEEVTA